MKPLARMPLTAEDTAIWCRVYLRSGRWPQFGATAAAAADRRDADVMRIGVMNPWCLLTWQAGCPSETVLLRGPKTARRRERSV